MLLFCSRSDSQTTNNTDQIVTTGVYGKVSSVVRLHINTDITVGNKCRLEGRRLSPLVTTGICVFIITFAGGRNNRGNQKWSKTARRGQTGAMCLKCGCHGHYPPSYVVCQALRVLMLVLVQHRKPWKYETLVSSTLTWVTHLWPPPAKQSVWGPKLFILPDCSMFEKQRGK